MLFDKNFHKIMSLRGGGTTTSQSRCTKVTLIPRDYFVAFIPMSSDIISICSICHPDRNEGAQATECSGGISSFVNRELRDSSATLAIARFGRNDR